MPSSRSSQEPKPPRTCFGCLFSSGLGCMSFFIGSVLAAALLGPHLLGAPVARIAERLFDDRFRGELEIESLEFAWKERQSADGVQLKDWDGERIMLFKASRLPSFIDLESAKNLRFTLDVHEANLVFDDGLRTNLAEALTVNEGIGREGFFWSAYFDRQRRSPVPYQLKLFCESAMLSRASAPERATELTDMNLEIIRREGLAVELRASAGENSGSGEFDLELDFEEPGPLGWQGLEGSFEASSFPAQLIELVIGTRNGALGGALGSRLGVEAEFSAPEEGTGAATEVTLSGERGSLQFESVVSGTGIDGRAGGSLSAELELGPDLVEGVLKPLLPWIEALDLSGSEGDEPARVQFSATDFHLPASGDPEELDGTLVVHLGEVRVRYVAGYESLFGASERDAPHAEWFDPLVIRIERGVVSYESIAFDFAGHECDFAGTLNLATNRIELVGEVPIALASGSPKLGAPGAASPLDPDVVVPIQIMGQSHAPVTSIQLDVLSGFMRGDLTDALGEGAKNVLQALFPSDGSDE